MENLFPDKYLASIGGLSVDVRTAAPNAANGVHLSRRAGSSLEFRDYQPYAPGDDLRRVDWNVYSRTRHLFVRRFERPTAVPIFILVDASESMRLETPSRYETASRLAAAVASAGLLSQNPVFVSITDGAAASAPRAVTGRRGLVRVLAELAAQRTPGGSGIAAGLEALLPLLARKGPGVLVLLSDFFDDRGIGSLLDMLRMTSQRLVLLRITQPWDAEPNLQGDLELVDCESEARLQVSADDNSVLQRYRDAYRAYFDELDAFVRTRGAAQVVIDASAATLPQLEKLFPAGVLTV